VVPRHPYYAITDEDGKFRLDEVPPGRYRLVVWHEGVTGEGGAAVERRLTVTVRARRATPVAVDLGRAR
jgi:hypothetical protein